ncbi:uncharacterized protein LOC116115006 isoform X1 [Pistacia vera]|uniref:uncharacterized protein LOC116115006 isoform X1 n=2 Tax=Pistacia vera TaxID=55513 RepID=UPI001263806A|nr:uncharacterized protein LOC116115006 isoform X1 [Pistacia vera]XP_031257005.1 uncharacterized protein LOC116115006 isoform X1 [Pistacia vera]
MSRTGAKSCGWAAFDVKQRQKQGLEPEIDKDPYPPFTSTLIPLCTCESITKTNGLPMKPFASVLLPSVDFPTLTENKDCQKFIQTGDSDSRRKPDIKVIYENNHDSILKQLKLLYPWADSSLIEDILVAADNNIEKASTLLKGMVSSSSSEENMETRIAELSSMSDDFPCENMTEESSFLRKTLDLTNLTSTTEDSIKDNHKEPTYAQASCGIKLSDNDADMKSILEKLSSLPIEPEWEEDDVYLIHRKDALKMMRSASQHSKAADNAFLRGDHFSAQEHSLKARKEWLIAEKLNSKAAKEILNIRNSDNDMWKLDLHGLHATEAVQALQERLQQIKMPVEMNCSVSPRKVKAKNGVVHTSSLESFSCMDMEDENKQQASCRQIRKPLQVITGVGNHSRGEAALPTAVRSFLSENRYRFEETRPGVITVRPKFHHR